MWKLKYTDWDDMVSVREPNVFTVHVPLDPALGLEDVQSAQHNARLLWQDRLSKGTVKRNGRWIIEGSEETAYPCNPRLVFETPLETV